MTPLNLHYQSFGEGEPLIILHGLLGTLDNWQSCARILSHTYHVITVDQRNHGHSPHSDEFSYEAMTLDLLQLIDTLKLDDVLLMGHSMGGKTAMKFAQNYPDYVKKLIVVDIGPKAYPFHHQIIFEGISAIDFNKVKSRGEVEEILKLYIPNTAERQFILKNLYWKNKGELAWRFNLDAINSQIDIIGKNINDGMFEKPSLFIKGELSSYIQNSDIESIKIIFPLAKFLTIPNAGHWVHAAQPELFTSAVKDFLN